MQITLHRQYYTDKSTIGALQAGIFRCWALEDAVHDGPKIHGRTAIPAGTYRVRITISPRFGVRMPILIGVPGFEGVRIHYGNTADDTEGCLIVGMDRSINRVGRSRDAYRMLMEILEKEQEQKTWITITDGGKP